jgi:macrolide transport system ATP-binding/permease protein
VNFMRGRWLRTTVDRWFRRGRQEAAMDAEMQFHFDALVDEFRAEGLSECDARVAARREFGTVEIYREEVRDTWSPAWLVEAVRSLRFTVRSLRRTPGFTVIAVLTLSLGIGTNTAMFSVLNGIMLKPLPYPAPEQLEAVQRVTPREAEGALSVADFLDLRADPGAYGSLAAYEYGDVSLAEPGASPEFADAIQVTANFFRLWAFDPDKDGIFGRRRPGRGSIECW